MQFLFAIKVLARECASTMSSASIPRPCPPRLTGAVLDDSNLDIVIDVRGYHNLPSTFHDSRICLGLASHGERVLESCFEQVNLYAWTMNGGIY